MPSSMVWRKTRIIPFIVCIAIYFTIPLTVDAAVTHDLGQNAQWNIRIDGAASNDKLGNFNVLETGDINNDGSLDLIVGAPFQDNNSRSNSGSVYIIFGTVLSSLSGTGKTLDLATSSNWNIRLDGAAAGDELSWNINATDLNNNGRTDLIIGSILADNNSRAASGSVYVIYDSILDDYSGTGNTIDLASTSSWNIRYDGELAGDWLGDEGTVIGNVDSDGKPDIVFSTPFSDRNSRTDSGSLFIIYNTLIDDYSGTGNIVDLATSTNWNVRIDGVASDDLGYQKTILADYDNDGNLDIFTAGRFASEKGRTYSGSYYIIENSLITGYTGTGNTHDLATASNYSIQFQGAAAMDIISMGSTQGTGDIDSDGKTDFVLGTNANKFYVIFGSLLETLSGDVDLATTTNWNIRYDAEGSGDKPGTTPTIVDFNNDGNNDLSVGGGFTDFNSRSNSGSVYILDNSELIGRTGTGNTVTLSSSIYSIRFDGPIAGLGGIGGVDNKTIFRDLNNNGTLDTIVTHSSADYNSRTDSGSIYIIYNFPHTISTNSFTAIENTPLTITGSVSAANSTTTISKVQFQVDGNSPTAGWSDCIADDATFDQTSESFSCSVGRLTAAEHTIYIRAYDSNTAYTAQANYTTLEVDLRRGVTKINSYSPNHTPPLIAGEAAVFTSGASGVIIEKGAIPYNAAFSSVSEPRTHEIRFTKGNSIPGLAIYSLWITDSFNQARILPSLHKKPSIVALSYSDHQINGISESSLRLAYSQDMQTWKILPTSVVDPVNNTVAALNKVGGYYMIVRSLGAPSRIYEDVQEKQIVSEKQEELIEKKAESESKYLNNSSKDISNKSTPSQSLFQRIINTLKSFFTPPF